MTKEQYAFEYSKAVYCEVLERTASPSTARFHEMVAYAEAVKIWENAEGEDVKDRV